ncbi:MAG: non-canonical purine NTP pyrophosphatase [Acidimicrobiales bacterium]
MSDGPAGPGGRRRLLLATGNAHKVDEVQSILGDPWLVVALDPGVDETGSTFEENALLKARAVAASAGELAIADDSGIEVDMLGGAPGVRSARWAHEGDWIPRVLRELAGAPEAARGCRYVCAAAAAWPGPSGRGSGWHVPHAREFVVRGVVEGRVAEAPRGTGGFGYDPIMVPMEGDGRTFAEMSDAEKHALSHRGRAFRRLAPHLVE